MTSWTPLRHDNLQSLPVQRPWGSLFTSLSLGRGVRRDRGRGRSHTYNQGVGRTARSVTCRRFAREEKASTRTPIEVYVQCLVSVVVWFF